MPVAYTHDHLYTYRNVCTRIEVYVHTFLHTYKMNKYTKIYRQTPGNTNIKLSPCIYTKNMVTLQ
jgi:hypothetical protein